MAGRSIVVVVVLVLGSGCLAPSQGRVDRDAAEDDSSVADIETATATDTTVAPDSVLDTADAVEVEPCEVAVTTLAPVVFDGEYEGGQIFLDREVLYGPRRVAAPTGFADLEVVAHEIGAGKETILTVNDIDDHIVDARAGTVLVWRQGGDGQVLERLGADPWVRALPEGFGLVPGPYYGIEPRAMIDGPRTVWGESWLGGGTESVARVMLAHDGDVEVLVEVEGQVVAPYARGGRVVWVQAAPTPGLEASLVRWDGQASEVARGAIGGYALTARDVVWIVDGVLKRASDGGEEDVHAGPCTMLSVGGDAVAAVCARSGDRDPGDVMWGFGAGDVVVARADGGQIVVPVPDDRIVGAVAVDDVRVAWVEYAPGAGCGSAIDEERGTVWIADQVSGERVAVSEVGVGCWCCGAYWPLVDLGLGERHLAWSYGLGASGERPDVGTVWARPSTTGVARLACER